MILSSSPPCWDLPKLTSACATTMPFHAILLKQNWSNFTEVALFWFGRLHLLGVSIAKGPGDYFLFCTKSTSFKRQASLSITSLWCTFWTFFFPNFDAIFFLGLSFLGINSDWEFLTKWRLLTFNFCSSLQEQFQFRKGKDGHYIAHIQHMVQHMEIGLVLFEWRWWYIDILPGICSMLKINFFQNICFT